MKSLSAEALASSFRPGERIYLPGAGGEAAAFTEALVADSARTRGLEIVTSFVPGINRLPIDRMAEDVRVYALFMQPGLDVAQRDGRLRHLPVTYAGFVRDLRNRWTFDVTVAHVSPPDGEGRCSLGVAAEFTLLAARRSRRVVAVINPQMPALKHTPTMTRDDFAAVCEVDAPLRTYDPGPPDAAVLRIAASVAPLVPDEATLHLGIGKASTALTSSLHAHRGLRVWSGMMGDGFLDLADAGALATGFMHTGCAAVGSAKLYRALAARDDVRIVGCDNTHDAVQLAAQPRLVAVNSALEVDLYGQCNLELVDGRAVSGAGGAPDFARAASRGSGTSIVALPATAGRSGRSRIVPRLTGGLATLARHEVDVVATEFGAADLRGLAVEQRAQALIAVAAPECREDLARAWRDGPSVNQEGAP